ncbi:hypothetical protein EXN66_Car017145 [Channa argus]|uniref:Uncharacterized protein n=1 Tax=Channa argus TaxID=215402 RepID=A0A6G1QG63_CHAAH|nr:hypothetical protein EXN66_Car017145 [Channa argus]
MRRKFCCTCGVVVYFDFRICFAPHRKRCHYEQQSVMELYYHPVFHGEHAASCNKSGSSEPHEYSEEDTNTSASNHSTEIEFVRMSLISRL